MVSLALAGVFAGAAWGGTQLGAPTLTTSVLSWLASVNVMLGVFNLLAAVRDAAVHGRGRERACRRARGFGSEPAAFATASARSPLPDPGPATTPVLRLMPASRTLPRVR
jgi:hypothetical protein